MIDSCHPLTDWDLMLWAFRRGRDRNSPLGVVDGRILRDALKSLQSQACAMLARGDRCEPLERVAFWFTQISLGEKPSDWVEFLPQECLDAMYGAGVVRQKGDWSVVASRLGGRA